MFQFSPVVGDTFQKDGDRDKDFVVEVPKLEYTFYRLMTMSLLFPCAL